MEPGLAAFLRSTLLVIGALFPIVNPLGSAPIFLAFTPGFTDKAYAILARKIALNGFALLAISILIGTNILAFFGISLPVVQVGGGMVVIVAAWGLLNRKDDAEHLEAPPPTNVANVSRQAFYPLTMPLTVGPGSISVAITVGANRPPGREGQWIYLAAAILGAAVVAVTIYFSYRFAEVLAKVLGDAALNVILRLSSFILLCIGLQIAWNGLSVMLRGILTTPH